MERLFNTLPYEMQTITKVKQFDRWLRSIPDTSKINDYGASVGTEMNSIAKKNNFQDILIKKYYKTIFLKKHSFNFTKKKYFS